MGDAPTNEYQSFSDDVGADDATSDAREEATQQRIAKKSIIQEFDDIHPFSRRAFFALLTH